VILVLNKPIKDYTFGIMKYKYKVILMVILAGITLFGFITGRYLFLVFMIPLSFDFFNKKDKD
jgi:hypothetical protein